MCTPSGVGKPRLRVSSRRNSLFSSTKWQESHALEPLDSLPAPALVMHVPFNLAALHQAGAVVLFSCAIGLRHALRPAPQLQL